MTKRTLLMITVIMMMIIRVIMLSSSFLPFTSYLLLFILIDVCFFHFLPSVFYISRRIMI